MEKGDREAGRAAGLVLVQEKSIAAQGVLAPSLCSTLLITSPPIIVRILLV